MHTFANTSGNLLINGKFLPGLWTRLNGAPDGAALPCPVWAQTFAADRWRVRYAAPTGAEVSQACSAEIPDGIVTGTSLEIRGSEGVAQEVFTGQNIEAEEAAGYHGSLRFSAWLYCEHPTLSACKAALVLGSPATPDLFDSSVETVLHQSLPSIPLNRWTHVELTIKGTAFRPTGLRIDLAFPSEFLASAAARVRLTDVSLAPASTPVADRPPAVERLLARRYFQKHDGQSVNAIGRALTCNPHELFFQLSFPEMRALPACTLSQDNADLCVFSSDGQPQAGFAYDVTFGARTSVVIRATKLRHQLRDGYLAFRGYRGAILLDAEL